MRKTNHPSIPSHARERNLSPDSASAKHVSFGEYFRSLRLGGGLATSRDFCMRYRFDPGYISKMERGLVPPPPTEKKIARLAKAVGLKNHSAEWQEFIDRAFAARGEIPPDLARREEIVEKLPHVFSALRSNSPFS